MTAEQIYRLLHVGGVIFLAALTFQAFAAPTPATKKRTMVLTGILSVMTLVGGFGLLARLELELATWVIVKLVCWLGLSAMAGFAYRMPRTGGLLAIVSTLLILVALYMVYVFRFATG